MKQDKKQKQDQLQKQSLGKREKLKSRKEIDQLFKARQFVTVSPIRMFYQIHVDQTPVQQGNRINSGKKDNSSRALVQVGFSCSKKFFKQAVRRNRVKRLMREAYRKQKGSIWQHCEDRGYKLSLFLLYGHKVLPTQLEIDQKLSKLLEQLLIKLQ